ncbi:copper chaperone PCu(A)C [Luteimonas saliphila]|uniref:copper chaperone PCu(A)C n=1 Tax=Luteimonas saliphila TaxID=2804919 RepID=UPI00192E04F2|nr:copper chaperone PCu(A)C [Luteimonas saliphila]
MQTRRSLVCLALLFAAASLARADDTCAPVVESGWIRQPPMAMPMMAGFAEVRNPCDTPVAIVAAGSPAFASVELHETRKVDGVSRMRHVESLSVPARGRVSLAPGGLHLMLMRPQAEVELGQRIAIELELADGRKLRAQFEVRRPDAL